MPAAYKALDMLINDPPMFNRRMPFLRPRPAPVVAEVREPAWRWSLPLEIRDDGWGVPGFEPLQLTADENVCVLDANAAFLAAASSVEVAHGQLTKTGQCLFDARRPGYWLVDAHPWSQVSIWSPLGSARMPDQVWLTTPTVTLLDQLTDAGYWPGVDVHDSWTSSTRCRLRGWTTRISQDRVAAIDAGDVDLYQDIKTGYSQAVTMMSLKGRSQIHRPDWAQHIRAQHAANMWRRSWDTLRGNYSPILSSGVVDEIIVTENGLAQMKLAQGIGDRPPLRIDQTGRCLGTFKIKSTIPAEEWMSRNEP
jgi:hypothetical protein